MGGFQTQVLTDQIKFCFLLKLPGSLGPPGLRFWGSSEFRSRFRGGAGGGSGRAKPGPAAAGRGQPLPAEAPLGPRAPAPPPRSPPGPSEPPGQPRGRRVLPRPPAPSGVPAAPPGLGWAPRESSGERQKARVAASLRATRRFYFIFFPGETSLRSGGPVTSHQPQPGRNRWRVNFGGEGTALVCSGKGDVTEKGFNPRVPHSPPGLPQPAEQILDKSCPLPRSCPGRWGHPHSGDSPRPRWWHAVAQEPCPCRGVWVAPPAPVTASGIQLQPYPKQQGPGNVVWAWAVTRGGHGHGCGMAVGMDMVWVWVWVRVWMCHQEQVTLVTLPEVPSHQDARRVAER